MKNAVISNVTSCSLSNIYQRFREISCPHLHGKRTASSVENGT